VFHILKKKCQDPGMKSMVGDIEGLNEVWDTLDTCFEQSEKYIAEALDLIIKFWKYRTVKHDTIGENHLLLSLL
jgi:hypothetical protein